MGSRVYPANRHCDWIRTRSCGRRWPIPTPIGAAFGDEPQGHSRRILLGRGCIPCAVRKNTRSHRTRKYFQRAHARGRESARLKNALRPPRVVFVIGCVSCTKFSHFRQKIGLTHITQQKRRVRPRARAAPRGSIGIGWLPSARANPAPNHRSTRSSLVVAVVVVKWVGAGARG